MNLIDNNFLISQNTLSDKPPAHLILDEQSVTRYGYRLDKAAVKGVNYGPQRQTPSVYPVWRAIGLVYLMMVPGYTPTI